MRDAVVNLPRSLRCVPHKARHSGRDDSLGWLAKGAVAPVGMTIWVVRQTAREFSADKNLLDGKDEPKRDSSHKKHAMENRTSLRDPTRHKTARKRKSGRSVRNDRWRNELWIGTRE